MDSEARRLPPARVRGMGCALAMVIAAASVALPSARAAEPRPAIPEPTEVEKENARDLMDQGVDREEAKDYAAALKYYQAAHALVRLPMTGMAVARAQEGLTLYVEALESAAEVKRLPRRPRETPAYDRARREADAMIARLGERVPAVQVGVGGARGARVTIDGVALPSDAIGRPRRVNPGRHVIRAQAIGHRDAQAQITIREGEVLPVTLRLDPISAAAASDGGEPAPAGPPDAGEEPGAEQDEGGGVPALAWIGFGVGAAGLVVGGITGVMTLSEGAALEERCGTAGCEQSEIDAANVTANISNAGFAVGAVGVGVGIVALLLSGGGGARASAPRAAVQVAPWAGPGLSVRGVF